MERLQDLIRQYGRWEPLLEYVKRIQAYKEDFSLVVENSKSLLESIAKQICKEKRIEIGTSDSLQKLVRNAFKAIGYGTDDYTTKIASALSTISQEIGKLRNNTGITSHGKTLEEIEERNRMIDDLSLDFLMSSVELIAIFLITSFEIGNPRIHRKEKILYNDEICEEFNDFWDELYGEFIMGDYSYTASEILYYVDYEAYETEFKSFINQKELDHAHS